MELPDLLPSAPPSLVGGVPLYLSGEDALRVTAFNALAGVTLTLSGRFLPVPRNDEEHPRPSPFSHVIVPATDRTASVLTRGLGEGWLLEASVVASAATPQIGQCYATLSVVRGLASSAIDLATLAQGYVSSRQRIGWPGGIFFSSLDGGGALRSITGAVPGAGAELSETVPTGARWELVAFQTLFTAAVAVANRAPILTLDDGTTIYARLYIGTVITASQAWQLGWTPAAINVQENVSKVALMSLPIGVRLAAGHRIRTATVAIQAADQYSATQYLVREWIEGA